MVLNNRHLFSHNSGGQKSENKVPEDWVGVFCQEAVREHQFRPPPTSAGFPATSGDAELTDASLPTAASSSYGILCVCVCPKFSFTEMKVIETRAYPTTL